MAALKAGQRVLTRMVNLPRHTALSNNMLKKPLQVVLAMPAKPQAVVVVRQGHVTLFKNQAFIRVAI